MKLAFTTLKLALLSSVFISGQVFAQWLTCTNSDGKYVDDSYARVKLDHRIFKKYKSMASSIQQAPENRLYLIGAASSIFGFVLNNFGGEDGNIIFPDSNEALKFCNSLAAYCKKTVFNGEDIKNRPADGSAYRYVLVGYDGWSAASFKYINVYYRQNNEVRYSVCPNAWYKEFPNKNSLLHYGKLR